MIFMYFFIFILLVCYFSLMSFDPFKSCLLMILSLMLMSFILSFSKFIWVSYFVCLLFLSGIFVILIYFSSLSSFFFFFSNYFIVSLILLMNFVFIFIFNFLNFSLSYFFYNIYLMFFFFFILVLFYFLIFLSFFLSFNGALRKY
uniref:NADH dehydrogenase subunit 6 n=1 Tax=Bursaphelenchus mucronatus TaxID=6325 RepID=M4JDC1_BURMU|nr:NADH dehydrogenase subunit 6 [Bursaphelenchus mucronatus]AGC41352.1 NADH dehydrogenase subunit 6 [Bursaphelenchus mucronatus]